jgi:hypothetical protein
MLSEAAVRFEDETLDVADLVLIGLLTGQWQSFEADLMRRMDLVHEGALEVTAEQLRAQATKFRYARGLVSAAEFTAWLQRRSLTLSELSGVLSRSLLAELSREPAPEHTQQADLHEVLRAEALCGGILDELAAQGMRRLSASHRLGSHGPDELGSARLQGALSSALSSSSTGLPELGEQELRQRLRRLAGLEDALAETRRRLASPEAVTRVLSEHRLDWLRLSGRELCLAQEGAAREARLLIRDDGLTLEEVAARAEATVQALDIYLEDVPQTASAMFLAGAAGEVLGPWQAQERWHVLVLERKASPSITDPILHERASEEILTDALKRHGAGRSELLGAF